MLKIELLHNIAIVGIAHRCAKRVLFKELAHGEFRKEHPTAFEDLLNQQYAIEQAISDELKNYIKIGG